MPGHAAQGQSQGLSLMTSRGQLRPGNSIFASAEMPRPADAASLIAASAQ